MHKLMSTLGAVAQEMGFDVLMRPLSGDSCVASYGSRLEVTIFLSWYRRAT